MLSVDNMKWLTLYYFYFVFFFLDGPFLFLAVVLVLALLISILELLCHACAKKEPGIAWKAIFARDLVSILILLTSTRSFLLNSNALLFSRKGF
jgi:hypothetical protein